MGRLREKIGELNETVFNPVGLNVLWPRNVAFLFVGINYHYMSNPLTDSWTYLASPSSKFLSNSGLALINTDAIPLARN
jgi:hypothetical protein